MGLSGKDSSSNVLLVGLIAVLCTIVVLVLLGVKSDAVVMITLGGSVTGIVGILGGLGTPQAPGTPGMNNSPGAKMVTVSEAKDKAE